MRPASAAAASRLFTGTASARVTALAGSMGASNSMVSELVKELKASVIRTRNVQVIESDAVKVARNEQKKRAIIEERKALQLKLEEVDRQRESIIKDYKVRHPKVT
jgi:hypothetical protein